MLELRAGDAVATVDPEGGGRLTRLAVGGVDLLTDAGCFLMAPWAGRLGYGRLGAHQLPINSAPHAIHGTVRDLAWTVVDGTTIETPLGPIWPWAGRCTQSFDLHPDHLATTVTIRTDGDPFPAALGWHPWFTKPASVHLDADAMLEREDFLPTGRRVPRRDGPVDDCFEGVRWPVTLTWANGLEVDVEADGCDHVVLFDVPADATCVEPQTAPPNAPQSGEAATVTIASPLTAAMRIRWRLP